MKTDEPDIISIQQIRDDPNGFVDSLAKGKSFNVIRRSKKVAFVTGKSADKPDRPKPGSPEAMQEFIKLAAKARSQAKGVFDPNKSIKQLYAESMDEKYGISRRESDS